MGLIFRSNRQRGVPRAALALLGVVAVACGPGFQAVYEGNARFEHCYGLEETPQATMREKSDCWRDWSDHYTYGQTRDRIQYAIARYVALSQAPNIPTDEALMMAAPGMTPRVTTITAPAPTNAFAPPPKVLEMDGGVGGAVGRAPAASAAGLVATAPEQTPGPPKSVPSARPPVPPAPPAAPLPGSTCAQSCEEAFRTCGGDAGASAPDSKGSRPPACDDRFRKCMRACYR